MAAVVVAFRRTRRLARLFQESRARTGSLPLACVLTVRHVVSRVPWHRMIDPALAWGAFAVSLVESGPTVVSHERYVANGALGPRVAVFCHFDLEGRIRACARHYLESLRAEGFDLVFVTNAGRLQPDDQAWICALASHLVIRKNRGYDFGAWRDGLSVSGLPGPDTRLLLITNDSAYGPITALGPMMRRIDFAAADVWSVTDSWQHGFHLQSYFVAFGPAALRHEVFARFWRSVGNVRSKWWAVHRHELGLSREAAAAGLRCKALWPYSEMMAAVRDDAARDADPGGTPPLFGPPGSAAQLLERASGRMPLNPTADLWRVLLEHGCPFLKRELLRKNPSRVPGVDAWPAIVGRMNPAMRDRIVSDLDARLT